MMPSRALAHGAHLPDIRTLHRLRIRLIPYLVPPRSRRVRAPSRLRYDAFEIVLLSQGEEGSAPLRNMVRVYQRGACIGQDAPQTLLALHQRQRSQIFAVKQQQVECEVRHPSAPPQQHLEVHVIGIIEAHDLAVDDRVVHSQLVLQGRSQCRKSLQYRGGLRTQPNFAVRSEDVRHAPEAVVLPLEDPLWIVERLSARDWQYGLNDGQFFLHPDKWDASAYAYRFFGFFSFAFGASGSCGSSIPVSKRLFPFSS